MFMGINKEDLIPLILATIIIFLLLLWLLRNVRKWASEANDPKPPSWRRIAGTTVSMMAEWVKGLVKTYTSCPIKGRLFIESTAFPIDYLGNSDVRAETEAVRFQRVLGSWPLADSAQSADTIIQLFWGAEYHGAYGEVGKYGKAGIPTCRVTVIESSTGRIVRRKTFRGSLPPSTITWKSGERPPDLLTTQLGKLPTKQVEEYIAGLTKGSGSPK